MQALADAVGLGTAYLRFGVLNVFIGQTQLLFMVLRLATVLGFTNGFDAQQHEVVHLVQRQDLIVQQVSDDLSSLRAGL